MKYFLHDSNSFNDEKISELFMSFGYEGLGLFYSILEKIASQEKPIKTSVLKSQLKVGKRLEKCWSFMESLGVINSLNGETFNERLLNYSETYQIKKQKNSERISQWRDKQQDIKNVTRYEQVCNTPNIKISKEKVVDINKEEKEILKNWEYEKGNFLMDETWQMRFCTERKTTCIDLKKMMQEFITTIELKEDFKDAKELKRHFTNVFDKNKKDNFKFTQNGTKITNGITHSSKSAGAYELLERIKKERGIE